MRHAAILAVAALAACASGQLKQPKALACQHDPQWFTTDEKGRAVAGVYVCFGDAGQLLYTSRPLTLEQLEKMSPPAPVPPQLVRVGAKKAAPK